MKTLLAIVLVGCIALVGCDPKDAEACDACGVAAVASVQSYAVAAPAFVQSHVVAYPQVAVQSFAVAAPVYQSYAVAAPVQAVAFGGCASGLCGVRSNIAVAGGGCGLSRSRAVSVNRSFGALLPRRSVSRSRAVSVTRGF